jgi:hypothetical protein
MLKLLRRIQAENLAAPLAALLNNGQKPRVACLPLGNLLDLFRLALAALAGAGDLHRLGVLARALPSGPGLPLDLIVLGELAGLGDIQVHDAAFRPLCLDSLQVPADRAAVYIDFLGDLGLKLSLQIQAGNRFASLGDAEFVLFTPAGHVRSLRVRYFSELTGPFAARIGAGIPLSLPPGEVFPALDDHIAVGGVDLHEERLPAGMLGGD